VLLGPTASGKSALALELARSRPGIELVSVDSMQVYRGMDIGTAKPTSAEQAEVPHHLIDLVEPAEQFSVTRFAAAAADALSTIEQRGATAVLVGGTGLYLHSVLGDLSPPGEYPDVRAELEAVVRDHPGGEAAATVELHRRLAALDPLAAQRAQMANTRRVVRALEVTLGSGSPFSSFGPGIASYGEHDRFALVGLWLPRPVLGERIDRRVGAMVSRGLLDEVRILVGRDAGLGRTARQALGYKELLAHIEGGADLDGCITEIRRRTRAFARRQRAWFRRDPRIRWHATAHDPARLLGGLVVELDRCRPRG